MIKSFHGIQSIGASGKIPPPSTTHRAYIYEMLLAGISIFDFYSDHSHPEPNRMGTGILKYGRVTLDYKNNKFYFEPHTTFKTEIKNTELGLSWLLIDGEVRITSLEIGGKAQLQGAKLDVKIISINGESLKNISTHPYCERYRNGWVNDNTNTASITCKSATGQFYAVSLVKE